MSLKVKFLVLLTQLQLLSLTLNKIRLNSKYLILLIQLLLLLLLLLKIANENDIAKFVKETDYVPTENELNELSQNVKTISTKILTKDLINKFSTLNSSKYFCLGMFQNYLLLIPAKKCIKYFDDTTRIDLQKTNGMSEEKIENITKSDSNFAPTFVDFVIRN